MHVMPETQYFILAISSYVALVLSTWVYMETDLKEMSLFIRFVGVYMPMAFLSILGAITLVTGVLM